MFGLSEHRSLIAYKKYNCQVGDFFFHKEAILKLKILLLYATLQIDERTRRRG